MKIRGIKDKIKSNQYMYSHHAEIERINDNLTFYQIEDSILNGEILEQYEDIGRGESCLIIGKSNDTYIHTVCGWRGEQIVIITVYTPKTPKFIDPWTRRGGEK